MTQNLGGYMFLMLSMVDRERERERKRNSTKINTDESR
jgi:hypothetical protein